MTVRTRHHSRTRSRLGRDGSRRSDRQEPVAEAEPAPQLRERSAGGPQDQALYRCACGCVFEASVSASVGCPRCGGAQAW